MEFEWDDGNLLKNLIKHGIAPQESEQVFMNEYLLVIDESHSIGEMRFRLLGESDTGKVIYIAFTTRGNKIRIISAQIADKRERRFYEQRTQGNSKI